MMIKIPNNSRILTFDVARSICMIWIVCFWHISNYILYAPFGNYVFHSEICAQFTKCVLACFFFLSGLFSNKFTIKNKYNIFIFYKHKLIRFYPLYVVSIITILFANYPPVLKFYDKGLLQIILSFFGLSSFFNVAPSTLWFMDLLLFYILLTPILLQNGKIRKIKIILFISIIFFLVNRYTNYVDSRVVLYFPFYSIGLLFAPDEFMSFLKKNKLLIMSLSLLILSIYHPNRYFQYVYISASIVLIIYLSMAISYICSEYQLSSFFIQSLSYLCLCAYLFHRQIIKLCLLIGVKIIFIPFIVLMLAYFIQKVYDKILVEKKL